MNVVQGLGVLIDKRSGVHVQWTQLEISEMYPTRVSNIRSAECVCLENDLPDMNAGGGTSSLA